MIVCGKMWKRLEKITTLTEHFYKRSKKINFHWIDINNFYYQEDIFNITWKKLFFNSVYKKKYLFTQLAPYHNLTFI